MEKLKNEGVVTRTYGGAMLNTSSQGDRIHFFKRRAINLEKKQKIAKLFAREYGNSRTIMFDNSTTVIEAVKLLKDHQNLTAISFSAQIFQELEGTSLMLISTGGIFDDRTRSYYGSLAKDNIRKYNVDVALLGCKGLDLHNGVSDSSEGEADLKAEMAARAKSVVLLADDSKFGQKAFVNFADWDSVNCIITNKKPDNIWTKFCESRGIRLIFE